jgi:hypothetical protein
MLINASELMVGRDVIIEAEVVEQPSRYRLHAHHRRFSRKSAWEVNHATRVAATAEFFNGIGGKQSSGNAGVKGSIAPFPVIASATPIYWRRPRSRHSPEGCLRLLRLSYQDRQR